MRHDGAYEGIRMPGWGLDFWASKSEVLIVSPSRVRIDLNGFIERQHDLKLAFQLIVVIYMFSSPVMVVFGGGCY